MLAKRKNYYRPLRGQCNNIKTALLLYKITLLQLINLHRERRRSRPTASSRPTRL
jgi:hypothetical protein